MNLAHTDMVTPVSSDDLYALILNELTEGKVAYAKRFGSFYIVSIGSHIFNLTNRESPITYWSRAERDFRLHTFFVAPPGYGKTFFMDQFVGRRIGILSETNIHCDFEQAMTEAGWVGTARNVNGDPVRIPGLAEMYKSGIVAVEEFSSLIASMQSQHSKQLKPAILTSLDSGRVRKKLGVPVAIRYETCVTLWSGTQVTNFDVSGGLARRLCWLVFFPTKADQSLLKRLRREGANVRFNPVRLTRIRSLIDKKLEDVKHIKHISFDKSFYKVLNHYKMQHFEEPFYESMALGYFIVRYNIGERIVVRPEPELKRLFSLEAKWRLQLARGGQISHIIAIIKEQGDSIHINDLRVRLAEFQIDWAQSSMMISDLIKKRVLTLNRTSQVVSIL